MIVDAHVHVFPRVHGYGPKGETRSAGYGGIDFGDGKPSYVLPVFCEKTSHTVEMLLHNMDRCGVDKAVILLCPCYGDWSDYVQDACLMYPEKLTGCVFRPLEARRKGILSAGASGTGLEKHQNRVLGNRRVVRRLSRR